MFAGTALAVTSPAAPVAILARPPPRCQGLLMEISSSSCLHQKGVWGGKCYNGSLCELTRDEGRN
ncbi:MAG: hypothetical protein NZ901_00760 [Geminocystis sp.]|nr:hypothetical protein [Geminocystis sp.]MCS7146699.1 hypothetical protein [Geminocystis sp.]MCX8077151.1 hypothetical protein [Geminocystis sp.]MDW8115525.1 hypothetical protein [Geminocystis sp.]MDW8463067.1 hypothetical protein [Geminocystis sp.]